MSQDAEQAQLSLARQRGYLLCQGSERHRARLQKLWRRECLHYGDPIVVVTKHYSYRPRVLQAMIRTELCGDWWLSRRLWTALLAEMNVGWVARFGNSVLVSDIPHRQMTQAADILLTLLTRHRPSQEEAFDIPAPLARGPARCVYVESMEDLLSESETYVIREIPNALGHVVVFRPSGPPLVGIHLERFELLHQPER